MENVIAFPGMGLSVTVNRVAFSLFGKDIYWYGMIIAFGFALALFYCSRRISDFGFTSDLLFDAVLVALPTALVCARLYYVVWEWDYYSQNPSEIIAIWNGGIAIYGGVIGALLAVGFYGRHKKISIPGTFDVAALGLLIGQCIGRWGNFVNGEAHGTVTDSILGMTVNGEGRFTRHSYMNPCGIWLDFSSCISCLKNIIASADRFSCPISFGMGQGVRGLKDFGRTACI